MIFRSTFIILAAFFVDFALAQSPKDCDHLKENKFLSAYSQCITSDSIWKAIEKDPMRRAILNDDVDQVKKLLSNGYDLKQVIGHSEKHGSFNVLAFAILKGSRETFYEILENGADVLEANERGLTPLNFAKIKKDKAKLTILKEAIAKALERKREEERLEALQKDTTYLLKTAIIENNLEFVKSLILSKYNLGISLGRSKKYGNIDVLSFAILKGSPEMTELLAKATKFSNAFNDIGWTPLGIAIAAGKVDKIDILLKAGAKPSEPVFREVLSHNKSDEEDFEYMICSDANCLIASDRDCERCRKKCRKNEDDCVECNEICLKKMSFEASHSPLCIAAKRGRSDIIAKLMRFRVNISDKCFNKLPGSIDESGIGDRFELTSPICYAVANKDYPSLELFLKAGLNPNLTCIDSTADAEFGRGFDSPLYTAVANSDEIMTKILLGFKANPNEPKYSPNGCESLLKKAIENENENIVKMLIAAKADVNETVCEDSREYSPLELAEQKKNQNIISMLKKAGAKKMFSGSFVEYCNNPDIDEKMIMEAIKQGANVNEYTTPDGTTPLHVVAMTGKNPKAMQALIKNGASVFAMTSKGWTPLALAAYYNPDPTFIKILIAAGSDLDITIDGFDLLHIAVNKNTPAVLSALLSAKVDKSYTKEDKSKFLVYTVNSSDNPQMLVALYKNGYTAAPPNGSYSWTSRYSDLNPLFIAIKKKKDLAWFKLLIQGHASPKSPDLLTFAIENNVSIEIIQFLIKAGAPFTNEAMQTAIDLPINAYRNKLIEILSKAKRTKGN